ncbi:MAG: type II toxin-antitoxin system RelE/ParE family toxin [Deltaproteobacteria bacterium]|nr:type II toxin-antitoxin system RelE/ParE family toxin [Deltaproteobacteria bacterium]
MPSRHEILWTDPALEDLRDIREYVSRDDPSAAKGLADKIRKGVLRLADHPLSGRIVPELAGLDYREVIISPYRIVYMAKQNRVIILRVWHGRSEMKPF